MVGIDDSWLNAFTHSAASSGGIIIRKIHRHKGNVDVPKSPDLRNTLCIALGRNRICFPT